MSPAPQGASRQCGYHPRGVRRGVFRIHLPPARLIDYSRMSNSQERGRANMLTGRHLLFVGGDARQLEVISTVLQLDASVSLAGFDTLPETFADAQLVPLTEESFRQVDALVLPVAGIDNNGTVSSHFSPDTLTLTPSHFAAMSAGTFVFTGISQAYLAAQCTEHSLRLVRLMELDEVAILNSIPTAEGAIALAMEHTDITIHSSRCLVLGFGRCGQTLARSLDALRAKVGVVARGTADLARIEELGFRPVPLAQLSSAVADEDVIFNTIPFPVLTASVLKEMKASAVIIDIASRPGGTDFRYAERRRLKAILAPSLPGMVAPKTAGRIIAGTLSRILAEAAEEGGMSTWI